MSFIKRTREEKINVVLDSKIQNLELMLRQTLYNDLLNNNISDNIELCRKFVIQQLQIKNEGLRCRNYWICRGWNVVLADIKSREAQKLVNQYRKGKSPYSIDFWTTKINPNTGIYYTVDDANFERNCRRPIRKEYWIKHGKTEQEAQQLALQTKNNNNKNGAQKSKDKTSLVIKAFSKRCKDYWTLRGYTDAEARHCVANIQSTFTLKKCIEKYGFEIGNQKWLDRQNKWQNTMYAKSSEEINKINKKKFKRGISTAENIIYERLKVEIPTITSQFVIFSKDRRYIFDMAYQDKLIEYNGDFWHANPKKFSDSFVNKRIHLTAKEIWNRDKIKIEVAINQGYKVLVIWEFDFKKNEEDVINKCKTFLKG